MQNFWGFDVWGSFNVFSVLLVSLLAANMLKKNIPFLEICDFEVGGVRSNQGMLSLSPDKDGTDGFFVSKFIRK